MRTLLDYVWSGVLLAGLVGLNGAAWKGYHPPASPEFTAEQAIDPTPPPEIVVAPETPELVVPPPVAPPVRPGPSDTGKAKADYDTHLKEGRGKVKIRKLHGAIASFRRAEAAFPGGEEAPEERKAAEKVVGDASSLFDEVRVAIGKKDRSTALVFLQKAGGLVADDPQFDPLRSEVEALRAEVKLFGSVLVLVLYTKGCRLAKDEFAAELEKITRTHGEKTLLGGRVYVLTPDGSVAWKSGTALPKKAFDNRKFDAMFKAAFEAVEGLARRADNAKFKTVIVWETDYDPDLDELIAVPMVVPPAGREFRLIYGFTTGRDKDSERPAKWFTGNAKRYPGVENIADFADYYVKE